MSNFDTAAMKQLIAVAGSTHCATNQVLYSLAERGIERTLLPWLQQQRMPCMAYSPIDQGALPRHKGLAGVADKHSATPAQIALAWVLSRSGMVAIPKAVRETHLKENIEAERIKLGAQDLATLEAEFPPPRGNAPLAMR